MTNYEYGGSNAICVAKKVIDLEKRYFSTDYESLSFEEKCRYAVEYTVLEHPFLAPDPKKRAEMLDGLRPELLRRAEKDDPFALYALGCRYADLSALSTEEEYRCLERSMEAGYLPAAFALLNFFYNRERQDEIRAYVARRAADRISDKERYRCYLLTNDERLTDAATGLALRGDISAVNHLASLAGNEECKSFWQTVRFLVYCYFYDKGAEHLGHALGMMLVEEQGCELDRGRILNVFFDLMSRASCDEERLRGIIRSKGENEVWATVLTVLLSGNPESFRAVCGEVARSPFYKELLTAYRMLCGARVRK